MDIWQAWDFTKKTLDYRKVEAVTKEIAPKGNFKDAAVVLVFAAIYSAVISILMNVMALYTARAFYVLLGVNIPEIELNAELLAPYAIYFFGLIMPLGLVVILISQFIQFRFLKLTKGKGSFDRQLFMYSLLTLAISIMSTVMLTMFFPCLNYITVIFFLGFLIYTQFYLQTKMVSVLHQISGLHAFVAVLIGTIISIAIVFVASEIAAAIGILIPVPEEVLNIPENALGEYNAV